MAADGQARKATRLTLRGRALFVGGVGYGNVYRFEVTRGDAHIAAGSSVTVTILASDHAREAFMAGHLAPQEVEIALARRNENEPYAMMPVTGMVDQDRTSWQIETLTAT